MTDFHVGLSRLAFADGDADFAQDFSGIECGGQNFHEEVSGFDDTVTFGTGGDNFGIGHIAIGCALSYLDFRFAEENWRAGCPRLAAWHTTFEARPSAKATQIVDA